VQTDTQGPSEGWAPPRLRPLDTRGTFTLNLHRTGRREGTFWPLEQGEVPVGLIERAVGGTTLRTASEECRVQIRRRARRLGWYLEVTRASGAEPALRYYPRTLRPGGQLVVSGIRRYRLRCPLLGADWRLVAVPGGEIGRIGFRDREPFRYLTMRLVLGAKAPDEPMLPIVILAASEAIFIHGKSLRRDRSLERPLEAHASGPG
jgi:hypothetical protein